MALEAVRAGLGSKPSALQTAMVEHRVRITQCDVSELQRYSTKDIPHVDTRRRAAAINRIDSSRFSGRRWSAEQKRHKQHSNIICHACMLTHDGEASQRQGDGGQA